MNNIISSQIHSIPAHINSQQLTISNYLNKFKEIVQNKIATLEDEIISIQQAYQIDNSISLLRNHIEDIGQVIFSSKLGIIPRDILTKTELDLIDDFDSYSNVKITVIFHENAIVIVLLIPKYSKQTLSKLLFEPMPTIENKSLLIIYSEVLVDSHNKLYNHM